MGYVKLWLDTRRERKDGTFPIKLYVYYGNGKVLLSLPLSASAGNWDRNEFCRKEAGFKAKNALLREYLNRAEDVLCQLERSGKLAGMPPAALKAALERAVLGKKAGGMDLWNVFDELPKGKSDGTAGLYAATKGKVGQFDAAATLDSIDKRWLAGFDEWMSAQGLKTNTRSIHMRNLRAVFNYAIDGELTGNYPFRKFRIVQEETRKRAMSPEQVALLARYECEPYQCKYRDMFMLMFFLIGINAKDLFLARPEDLRQGRLEYRRAKTGKLYSIKVEPEAAELIGRYRGKDYLLFAAETYTDYKDFLRHMNRELRKIGPLERKGLGGKKFRQPLFPEISSYWARHSWATIAASLDIPKETISEALGHEIGSPVTSIYIDFDRRKVDEANRRVIDRVLYGKG